MIIGVLVMAVLAGGSLYTAWPAVLARREKGAQQADKERAEVRKRAEDERVAQEKAAAEKRKEDHARLRANPVEVILSTVIRGLDPVGMRAAEESAQSALEAAKQETADAEGALAESESAAPSWYGRPVLRALVLASVPALGLVVAGNCVFEFLMLKNVSSGVVAVVFAGFMPLTLLGCASLSTFGMGFHTDRRRSQTQRACTVAGVVGVIAALTVLGYLAPLRTAEKHASSVATRAATLNSVTVQNAEDPAATPDAMVDQAKAQLTAAQNTADADGTIQRVFGVGLGLAEVLFAEVALQSVFLIPIFRGRRRLMAATSIEDQAHQLVVSVTGANDARIQNTTTSALEYLTAQGIPDPRQFVLQAVAHAGVIVTAVETADLSVMRAANRPNRSSLAARLNSIAAGTAAGTHAPQGEISDHLGWDPDDGENPGEHPGDNTGPQGPAGQGSDVTVIEPPSGWGEPTTGAGAGALDDRLLVDDFDISA